MIPFYDTITSRVKVVWLLDYPEGGKTAYTVWEESVASTLNARKGATGSEIRSYALLKKWIHFKGNHYETETRCQRNRIWTNI